MSWTPDLFIGEFRPWPDSVVVTRGNRIDSRIYVPQEALIAKELSKCHVMAENAKLRELVRELYQCSRQVGCDHCGDGYRRSCSVLDRMRELGVEVEG